MNVLTSQTENCHFTNCLIDMHRRNLFSSEFVLLAVIFIFVYFFLQILVYVLAKKQQFSFSIPFKRTAEVHVNMY